MEEAAAPSARLALLASHGEARVVQDGVRDASTLAYRADESGGWVWEASHALEAALVATVGAPSSWDALRVLELGSGTGLLALRLAQRGASVTATDREGAMRRIVLNVAKNQQRFGVTADGDDALRVECAALDWEAELERERRRRAAFDGAEAAADGAEAAADGAEAREAYLTRRKARIDKELHAKERGGDIHFGQ